MLLPVLPPQRTAGAALRQTRQHRRPQPPPHLMTSGAPGAPVRRQLAVPARTTARLLRQESSFPPTCAGRWRREGTRQRHPLRADLLMGTGREGMCPPLQEGPVPRWAMGLGTARSLRGGVALAAGGRNTSLLRSLSSAKRLVCMGLEELPLQRKFVWTVL
jgi:hypothetical protein